ncbi:partial 3-succinoylsemialdehyde-pyridine dehydrogenase, partial [Burkholderiales bacterium]
MVIRDKLYIDGRWVPPSTTATVEVQSASSEEVLGRIPAAGPKDAAAAVAAARQAFGTWSATPVTERAAFLKKIQEGLKARSEEIARCITGEVGMPLKLSTAIQAGSPIATFGMYARLLPEFA